MAFDYGYSLFQYIEILYIVLTAISNKDVICAITQNTKFTYQLVKLCQYFDRRNIGWCIKILRYQSCNSIKLYSIDHWTDDEISTRVTLLLLMYDSKILSRWIQLTIYFMIRLEPLAREDLTFQLFLWKDRYCVKFITGGWD